MQHLITLLLIDLSKTKVGKVHGLQEKPLDRTLSGGHTQDVGPSFIGIFRGRLLRPPSLQAYISLFSLMNINILLNKAKY